MRYLMIAALAATTAIATPAFAQDAPFSGPRIGVIAGYESTGAGSSEDSDIQDDDQTIGGFTYGADIGYDLNLGKAVIGAEAEISDSTAKVDYNNPDANYFGYGRVKTGRDLYVGLRAGVLADPRTLVYVKGGYTNARLDVLASDGTTEVGRNFKLDGYRVGAGVERQLNNNVYAKIEYRYSNYSNANLDYDNGGGTIGNFGVDTDRHQVVAGIGFRF